MAHTILVCGYGPGISAAVARKFGAEGYRVALVARRADKLKAGVEALTAAGVTAEGFPCDLSDAAAVKAMVAQAREVLGPIRAIHYNAYYGGAGDLTTCDLDDLRKVFDVGVGGAVAAVQAALPDLRAQDGASVLITGGGFSKYAPPVDKIVVQYDAMGLALAKAAQHKLTGLLHEKLAPDGIYVGSVVVLGMVKGTAFDQGGEGLSPDAIADRFWRLSQSRDAVSVDFAG